MCDRCKVGIITNANHRRSLWNRERTSDPCERISGYDGIYENTLNDKYNLPRYTLIYDSSKYYDTYREKCETV